MKKLITFIFALSSFAALRGQNGAGLLISEALPNPAGTDSPFEFVELIATRTINFAVTPYTVVVCNNGTGTAQGWVSGGVLSYAFEINTGTVNAGDVVYVGGSSMAPTGTILRAINTGTTNGDGFGTFNTGGVFGNGGTNADGIGVFDRAVATITNSTVPVDALFYGTGIGTALVNAGIDGYQLPVNDLYPGGKLQATSFIGPDAASAQYITATGVFNPVTGAFSSGRTWVLSGTFTNAASTVTLSTATPAAVLSFATTNQTVNENAGTVSVTVNITGSNNGQIVFTVAALPFSNATAGTDYTQNATTFVVPAGTATPQIIQIPVTDDVLAERDEYIVLAFTQLHNATASATAAHYLYIKDNDLAAPTATNELVLNLLTSFSNGSNATNSAEIVSHDPVSQRLFIANSIGAKLDIVNFSNPAAPVLVNSINISSYGNINSVAAYNNIVALAIENGTNPQDSGKVVFLDNNGAFISQVKVGAMPDMITFNHAHTKVVVACEGEPNTAYTNDPDGSVCVVDITNGVATVNQSNVSFITFTAFNGQENALRAQGIRIYGTGATTSKDFEPEYVTISDNDQTAWVTLQENNAIAEINLVTNTVTQIRPLGFKNHNTGANAMDVSDQTAGINLSNFPVKGMYLPDALYQYTVGSTTYVVTANEGDSRAYTGMNEEVRVGSMNLDATTFPYAAYMKSNLFLGRLNATNKLGDTDNDGDFDEIYSYGARSFSIWNAATGALVYDSGDDLERITSTHPTFAAMFNASNSTSAAPKNRSDDKGPEPEGVTIATVNGETYAFIAVERIGGVMIYNISNPVAPLYVGYYNNRSFATNGPDRGSEGIIFIPASQSPNGSPLVLLANETSSTLSIFQVQTCAQLAGVSVTPATPAAICAGNTQLLTANTVSNTSYQWLLNGNVINGATTPTYTANASGAYQVLIVSPANACAGKTDFVNLTVNPLPVVTASSSQTAICNGSSVSLSSGGATTYSWMPGSLSGSSVTTTPSATTTYTVTGTALGCSATATLTVTVNPIPVVTASASQSAICTGSSVTLNGGGASTYAWMPGSLSGSTVTDAPSGTTTYTVTGTALGCSSTATVAVTVNPVPVVTASASQSTICNGSSVNLNGGGATTYSWMPGSLSGSPVAVTPSTATTYTVTGTSLGCSNTATVSVAVNPAPTVTASSLASSICSGSSTTLSSTGATTYNWMPGSLSGSSVSVSPASTQTYTVTGTNGSGCSNTATLSITVLPRPNVAATASQNTLCSGNATTLSGTGANTYTWLPGLLTGSSVTTVPASTTTYTVTGAGSNGCSNTATVTITVNATPVVSVTPSAVALCGSSPVTLNANGVITYTWMPGTLSGSGVSVIPASTTTYTLTGIAANGCADSANVTITVNAIPVVSLTALNPDSLCIGDSPIQLSATPAGGTFNGNGVSGSVFTPAAAGPGVHTIVYSYTDGNNCAASDTTIASVDICTGIENAVSSDVRVYPNPFSDVLHVEAPFIIGHVEVFDMSGKIIRSENVNSSKTALETTTLPAGLYFVRVIGSEKQLVFKLSRI